MYRSKRMWPNCDHKHRPHAQLFFICIELLPPCQIRSRKMQYGEAGNCLVRFCTHFVSPMCTYILKRSLRYYHIPLGRSLYSLTMKSTKLIVSQFLFYFTEGLKIHRYCPEKKQWSSKSTSSYIWTFICITQSMGPERNGVTQNSRKLKLL